MKKIKYDVRRNKMETDLMFSSKSNEWSTPQDFYDKLHREFNFQLDAAATRQNTKCENFYDEETDALTREWADDLHSLLYDSNSSGSIWCNPPYGRSIGKWVKKAYEESRKGCVVVMLIPARTDTRYWHDYIFGKADEVGFVKGRLKFGGHKNAAPFPSAVVVFNNNSENNTKYATMDRA